MFQVKSGNGISEKVKYYLDYISLSPLFLPTLLVYIYNIPHNTPREEMPPSLLFSMAILWSKKQYCFKKSPHFLPAFIGIKKGAVKKGPKS